MIRAQCSAHLTSLTTIVSVKAKGPSITNSYPTVNTAQASLQHYHAPNSGKPFYLSVHVREMSALGERTCSSRSCRPSVSRWASCRQSRVRRRRYCNKPSGMPHRVQAKNPQTASDLSPVKPTCDTDGFVQQVTLNARCFRLGHGAHSRHRLKFTCGHTNEDNGDIPK